MKFNNLHLVAVIGFFAASFATNARMHLPDLELPQVTDSTRIAHSKEVLGGLYRTKGAKALKKLEHVSALHQYVFHKVYRSLPKSHRSQAFALTRTILESAAEHGFDPIFLVAVIEAESTFRPTIRGSAGEIGLMQIKPDTAAWIMGEKNADLKKMETRLFDVCQNVKIGARYLAKLRENFKNRGPLYVQAYNIGAAKLRSVSSRGEVPKAYYNRIIGKYLSIGVELDRDVQVRAQKTRAVASAY